MKKILAMILALCMVCSLLPMAATAEEALLEEEFLLEEVLPEFEEELIVEEPLPEAEEPFALPVEELPEELLFTEELEEIEANEAGNTISSTVSATGGYWADFEIRFTVENALKNSGYQLGIAFSAHSIELDEHGNGNCPVWNWDIPHEEPDKVGGGTVVRTVDQLVPGLTYNYFAVIMDRDGNIIQREAVRQFTTPNDSTGIKTIVPNLGPTALEGGRTMFSFFTSEAGFFTVKGENVLNIDIQDAYGEYVNGESRWEAGPGSLEVSFAAKANETVYIAAFVPPESTGSVTMEEGADLKPLSLGNNEFHTDQIAGFKAPKAGWYSFEINGDPSHGGMRLYDAGNGDWVWCDNGFYSAKLAAGEQIILQGQYDEREGTRTLTVKEVTPPAKDSVVSASKPSVIRSGEAEIEITVNISEATAATEGGFRIGILYSPYESFQDENGFDRYSEWSFDGRGVLTDAKLVVRPNQLVPGVTYYYKGFISDQNRDRFFFTEDTVHSFKASSDVSGITKLTFNREAPVPREHDSHYSFTATRNGLFLITAKGINWLNVNDTQGNGVSGDFNPTDSADFILRCCFAAKEGETFYITAGNYITDGAMIKATNVVGNVDALTLGNAVAVRDNQVVTFTAPEAGTYRVTTSNTASDALHIFNQDENDWNWRGASTGPMVMDANQTVFFITWYDERQETLSLTAEKISFDDHPENEADLRASLATAAEDTANLDFAYEIFLDKALTLTKNTDLPSSVLLYVNSALTLGKGVTLTGKNDIYLEKGSSLTVPDGATFTMQGRENWVPGIVLNGGKLINAGGKIIVNDDSALVISLDEYEYSFEKGVAAAGGVSKDIMIVNIGARSQADVTNAIQNAGGFGSVQIFTNSGSLTVPESVPQNTALVANEGSLTVPSGKTVDLQGAAVLMGGSGLVNNGTVNLRGLIQWNGASSFVNNGTLNLKPDSNVRIARWNPINSAEIKNNGKISRQGGTIDERIKVTGNPVVDEADTIPSDNIANFVLRCYTRGLNRDEASVRANDAEGLAYWYNILTTRQLTPAQVGRYFAVSPESQMKYPGNGEFIAMLYRLYMEDRSYDQGGYDYWLNLLTTNTLSREQIIDYFGVSPEFQGIVASYGLG